MAQRVKARAMLTVVDVLTLAQYLLTNKHLTQQSTVNRQQVVKRFFLASRIIRQYGSECRSGFHQWKSGKTLANGQHRNVLETRIPLRWRQSLEQTFLQRRVENDQNQGSFYGCGRVAVVWRSHGRRVPPSVGHSHDRILQHRLPQFQQWCWILCKYARLVHIMRLIMLSTEICLLGFFGVFFQFYVWPVSVSCPPPIQNRDFLLQRSWLATSQKISIVNRSVHHNDFPPKKYFIRGVSHLTG